MKQNITNLKVVIIKFSFYHLPLANRIRMYKTHKAPGRVHFRNKGNNIEVSYYSNSVLLLIFSKFFTIIFIKKKSNYQKISLEQLSGEYSVENQAKLQHIITMHIFH